MVMYLGIYLKYWETIMTQLIDNVHETVGCPKDFTEVKIIALKTNQNVAKCNNHRTASLITHTEKSVLKKRRYRNWDTENNIRTNFGKRLRIVCRLHRLAAGFRRCKRD
jgi:serine protease inhibitor ecotin